MNGPHYRHFYGGSDLIENFKLNAEYNTDTILTREVVQTPDRTQFRRQVTIVKEWKRATKRFRSRLEHNYEEGVSRPVKKKSQGHADNPPQELVETRVTSSRLNVKG